MALYDFNFFFILLGIQRQICTCDILHVMYTCIACPLMVVHEYNDVRQYCSLEPMIRFCPINC